MTIDNFSDFSIEQLKVTPFLYRLFMKYDEMAKKSGTDIHISGWDSYYLRWHISNNSALEEELRHEISTHCCYCGSTKLVRLSNNHDGNLDVFEYAHWCADCFVKVLNFGYPLNYKDLIGYHSDYGDSISPNLKKIRIRVKNPEKHYDYTCLDNLFIIDGTYYMLTKRPGYKPFDEKGVKIRNSKQIPNCVAWDKAVQMNESFIVPVTPLSVYTGVRDVTHERVYFGDRIVFRLRPIDNPEEWQKSGYEHLHNKWLMGSISLWGGKYPLSKNPEIPILSVGGDMWDWPWKYIECPLNVSINENGRHLTKEDLDLIPYEYRKDLLDLNIEYKDTFGLRLTF